MELIIKIDFIDLDNNTSVLNCSFEVYNSSSISYVPIVKNRSVLSINVFDHYSGRNRNKCKLSRRPMLTTQGKDRSPVSDVILRVIKSMSAPVTALHVTPMGAYRSDAHVGTYGDNPSVPDCSHWCLPGLPDMWNEILFTYLLHKDEISRQQISK